MGFIIIGIFMMIGGISCVVYGNEMNNSVEQQLQSVFTSGNTDPGNSYIVIGSIIAGIGFILLVVGIANCVSKNSHRSYGNSYNATGGLNYSDSRQRNDNRLLSNNGWKCICGVVNPSYTGTCGCGRTKQQIEKLKKNQQERIIVEQEKMKEIENEKVRQDKLITYNLKLDNIKKMKELLDAGAITQEEFDVKKKKFLDDM